jgi:hypothetical protein
MRTGRIIWKEEGRRKKEEGRRKKEEGGVEGGWMKMKREMKMKKEGPGLGLRFEADGAAGFFGGRLEEGQEFLVDVPEGLVVVEEVFFDFGQAFQDDGVAHQLLAHLDEGADDIDAHGDGSVGIQDGGRHEGAVFGEDPGRVSTPAADL